MQYTSQLQGISIATSLGLISEEMVLALGRLLRGEEMTAGDEERLDRGHLVLEDLASGRPRPAEDAESPRPAGEQSNLAAMQAMRLQAPDEDPRPYARRLADALKDVQAGDRGGRKNDLRAIRELFMAMSRLTLESAHDMARGTPEFEAWLNAPMTLRS